MHNLKKVVAVIAVLAMVLGTMVTGFAATVGLTPAKDIAGTDYADAAARLQALGVMIGYPDGTFKPGNPVTRTEFATIVDRILGLENAAKLAGGTKPAFTDVNADYQWAWGYINTAVSNSVVNGYPDGTFKPANQVTFAEAAAMLVRALGYEPSVTGAWPTNYLSKAAELGILKGVKATPDGAATRGDVALMVDNSLEVKMMERSTYGDTAEYKVGDKTLLTDKLNVEKVEGRVVETPAVNSSLKAEVVVDPDDEDLKNKTYDVADTINPDELLGLDVTAWVNDDDEIFYVEYDETQVKKDVLDGVDADKKTVDLKVAGDTFDVSKDAVVYVNGDEVDLDDLADLYDDGDGNTIYGNFIFDNDEVVFANLQQFNKVDGEVVTEVNKDDEIISTMADDASDDEIDLTDADEYVITRADGSVIGLSDIKANDVVYVADYNDTYHVVVVSNKVEGTLDRVKDDEAKIGDKTYDLVVDYTLYSIDDGDSFDTFTGAADLSDASGEDVVAMLDLKGAVKLLISAVDTKSEDVYGVVTKVDTYGDRVKIFANGGEKTYDFDGDVYNVSGAKATEGLDYLLDFTDGTTDSSKYALVKFNLNKDGVIEEIYVLGGVDGSYHLVDAVANVYQGTVSDLDEDHNGIKIDDSYYYVSSSTPIIDEINDMDAVNWDDIKDKTVSSTDGVEAIVVANDKHDAKLIVFTANYSKIAKDTELGVVLDKFVKSGDWYATVSVYDGKETDYKLSSSGDVTVGDIIEFRVGSGDKIATVSGRVYQTDDGAAPINNPVLTGYDSTVYYVAEKGSGYITLDRDTVHTSGTITYKIDSSTLVFDVTSGFDDIDAAKMTDIKKDAKVNVVVKNNLVQVIYLREEAAGTPTSVYKLENLTKVANGTDYDLTVDVTLKPDDKPSDFAVKFTRDGTLVGYAAISGGKATYAGGVTASGLYKAELFKTDEPSKILASVEKFIVK